jgi:phage tail sheath protein FI
MPVAVTYPGVYVEELPSGVHTIVGVATSIAAFVGRALRGPTDQATTIFSFADYQRQFGGLWRSSTTSYAVQQFFQNGGGQAIIVRVAEASAAPETYTIGTTKFTAASSGTWGANLNIVVDYNTKNPADTNLFNLSIYDDPTFKNDAGKQGGSGAREIFANLSINPADPRFAVTILQQQSQLLQLPDYNAGTPPPRPDKTDPAAAKDPTKAPQPDKKSSDGKDIGSKEVQGAELKKTGIYALLNADIFNILCIPPYNFTTEVDNGTWSAAATFCHNKRAMLLVDAPSTWVASPPPDPSSFTIAEPNSTNAAVYFPRLLMPDPLQDGNLQSFAPCGSVAGIYARTDVARGVWKAPAGTAAGLQGVAGFQINGVSGNLTDGEIGGLNPVGINSLRNLPIIGPVIWGARTLDGADVKSSDWKYVPVRRLALYLEESLFRSLSWVVFEPNDEPLWASIRLNVGAFMQGLFRQGAFQGQSAKDAYFVKCDKDTTTQNDINLGVVNIVVGFAPLKPAEFVVIQIQQMAGQIQT